MSKDNRNWIIMLILGISPFILVLIIGLFYSVTGLKEMVPGGISKYYGIRAFKDAIFICTYLGWPIYIGGIILIIKGVKELRNNKRKR